ncbi:ATP-binding SpoIIE family protein phosphatase [Actinacidiphila epipremni]|uniref:SpoIIE family protein phosphatase n=1 Tax=Actinacidiphila epipremni TaxID=2053013 RepID=A0ABX0ZKJ7_9ACTN|nr:ATP-binding SpoIIE family protein phosphatase [Actinacidiphila epipremni]NJP44373.1 SpoIIE family protein phosphatase [Actinacidiphila epipremni]
MSPVDPADPGGRAAAGRGTPADPAGPAGRDSTADRADPAGRVLGWAEAGEVLWLRSDQGLASAGRREAAVLARKAGLGDQRAADLALAVTEAATNIQRHAVDGALALRVTALAGRAAVEVLALDSGPGIADVAAALRDGTSTTGTLGVGLGTISRLADDFALHTLPGRGTCVHARFDAPAPPGGPAAAPPGVRVSGLTRPISGETQCGDTWAVREHPVAGGPPHLLVMMCDGLGHGPLAARAGDEARTAFRTSRAAEPAAILADIHTGLKGTRGAAVAVARVDPRERRVALSGVGNITALVLGADSRQTLMSVPGIVGSSLGRPRTFSAGLPPGSALVLHSDGLNSRWQPGQFPGLIAQAPPLIAAQLLWQAGTRRDDAGVVVVKVPS